MKNRITRIIKMQKLQFEIPENCEMKKVVIAGNYYGSKTFPSLNNLLAAYGTHPKQGGSMKRKFEKICCDEIRMQLSGYIASNPIILHYRFYEPQDGHYRDNMNIFTMADKCFEDALQVCKIIPNDNPHFMLNTTHDFFYLPEKWGEPYFEVYIEEVPDKITISKEKLESTIENFDLFKVVWFKTLERNKQILKRRLCDGCSFKELSNEYGISIHQVRNIVYEGTITLFDKYELK